MAKMHLHELLKEEQEPFVLKNYINEKRSHLKPSPPKTRLHIKRSRAISQNPSFPKNLCKKTCFFSSSDGKSTPLFDFTTPEKSPCRKPNNAAALILEAALRAPHSASPSPRQKSPKNLSFGLLASILKRISLRKKTQKRRIYREGVDRVIRVSVKDVMRWDSFNGKTTPTFCSVLQNEEILEMGLSFSCERSDWFEESGDKSMDLDLESCCSGSEECVQQMEFGGERKGDFRSCKRGCCSSPLRCREMDLLSGFRTPDFPSPASSPLFMAQVISSPVFLHTIEDGSISNVVEKEYEDEKDQFSPVSVLDPPFEDDVDDDVLDENTEVFAQSFKNVHRAKKNLLSKIRRFERLAELDPLELESRVIKEGEAGLDTNNNNEGNEKQDESLSSLGDFSVDMRRLLLDLAKEQADSSDVEVLAKVCKRIESWREVSLNTIDMTVELDLKREGDVWRRNLEEVGETVAEIEFSILGFLIEELSIDLVHSSSAW
ncbi:hypothetical protein AAC387_Pa12g0409 [Persea americana]